MAKSWVRYSVIAALLVSTVPAAHLMPGLDGSEVETRIRDSFHVVGFAAVAWALFEIAPFGRLGKSLTAFFGAVLIGALSELSQKLSGYFFNPVDVARDAAGAASMIFARVLWQQDARGVARVMFRGLAGVAGAAVLAPTTYWGWALLSERLKAPVIMDFEGPFAELYVVSTNAKMSLPVSGTPGRHAEIMLSRAQRSGILVSTALYDWSPYDLLLFDAEIAVGEDSVVSIHLNDYDSIGHYVDTQAGMITVSQGMSSHRVRIQDILVQAGRSDDAGNIRQVALLARSRNRGTILRIDNIRLE